MFMANIGLHVRTRFKGGVLVVEHTCVEAELSKLKEDLRRNVDLLDAANAELDSFSYSVSHDLRTPLRHINGFVRMLEDNAGAKLDESGRRYLIKITEAAMTMNKLIDALLSFSRIGRIDLRPAVVELNSLVQSVIDDCSSPSEGREIVWKKSALPSVHADPAMLRVAVANLISNALKSTRVREVAEIEVGVLDDKPDEQVFFVRDNGVGFDANYAGKLFGVFQRLHSPGEFEGVGIGLANVNRIVKRHGGKTWAEGKVDGGATFYFSLPR
jgi:light-regulated signal transduction histidine kinase (bacteriophytochrome)